ncbi:MAG: hypothetical protein ETSY1_21685 [Candidatus Entotheonella factor]|uniref:Guanylate cyclase domain-containing protein n=1 Tax=Entotheonella factor TaxID=1429438 RepID=W4LI71_ENTF1|nr:AAA family ATPase [Candidatus Entotheonella palauensis]ETW97682.1 MAG: hypothetical protein ETSY1_21685 [Candidatus Entotheonella factor]
MLHRFDGHIAQHLGDQLVVYFGYPQAHEDDAQRAVRMGLGVVEALETLNHALERTQEIRVTARVGIATGMVVMGAVGLSDKRERLALGETPHVAAYLQSLAESDAVLISADTYRLVEGYFPCQAIGTYMTEDASVPIAVYRAEQERTVRSRFDVAVTVGLTPLVGREQEAGLLQERWTRARAGSGQVVLLSADAGIGKSRLVRALTEHAQHEPHILFEYRCSPYYQHSAFYPVIESLQQRLQWTRGETSQIRLQKLEHVLESAGFALDETLPLLASLLSVPLVEPYTSPSVTPQQQKQKTRELLLEWLLQQAEQQPLCVVVEDLHWIDASTLELLSLLIDQAPMARMLLLLTFRPEFEPPWGNRSYVTQLTLSPLSHAQIEVLVGEITHGIPLPPDMLQQLVVKTDGVPLFGEELTKMVIDSGLVKEKDGRYELAGSSPDLAIPSTLHDLLMTRLDRLGAVKHTAQLGATLGKEFTYEVLQAVSTLDETALQHDLAQLVEAELLYQQGLKPRARYAFKHALIQEAAYQSLLRRNRRQYHERIAEVLTEQFPEIAETQPEWLAHHYTEAGHKGLAIDAWQRAGERAIQQSAYAEAVAHLKAGLALLETLPDAPARTQQELAMQTALGTALIVMKGQGAPEVEHTYARALALCRQMEESPKLFPVLGGLWRFYNIRTQLRTAQELAEQLLSLAEAQRDPLHLMQAHSTYGQVMLSLGALSEARMHFEQSFILYDHQQHRPGVYALNPGVFCLSYASLTLWLLGYPDQALQQSLEAVRISREPLHPYSLVWALYWVVFIYQFRREPHKAQQCLEDARTLATEHGLSPLQDAKGTIQEGWMLHQLGQAVDGIAQMRQGLVDYRASGSEIRRPYYLALLAEACGEAGDPKDGLAAVAEALGLVAESDERWWEAELYRLQGVLQQNVESGAPEDSLLSALDAARSQSAKSLELRAAISLSRLWQQQGRQTEAYELLAGIYEWFTEGHETYDLQEAQDLLAELG